MKFNQIWCVSYWHEWGVQRQTFFGPAPWGPQGESKGQISFNKSISKILYQTLRVFSQVKDTKHIRRDFHPVFRVMPQGWDFGALVVPRGSKKFFFKHGHVVYQIDGNDQQNRMHVKFSFYGQTDDLGVRSKVKYH